MRGLASEADVTLHRNSSPSALGTGAAAEVLQQVFGTKKLAFDWTSTVTGTTHHFDSTDDVVKEVQLARIAGGMHFRTSTVHGAVLGMKVSKWVLRNHFQPVLPGNSGGGSN